MTVTKLRLIVRVILCLLVSGWLVFSAAGGLSFADETCNLSAEDCNAIFGQYQDLVPDGGGSSTCNVDGSTGDGSTPQSIGTDKLSGLQVGFATKYQSLAHDLSTQYGIPWETVIAQGILESASGTSHFALTRNNFFGIGAVDSNPGAAASFPTPEAGFKGYYDFISGNPRYAAHGAFKEPAITDPIEYLKDIKAAGYATSPDYIKNVGAVVKGVQELATSKGWESSAQLAASHPEMLTNAAKYAAGKNGSSVSNDTGDASSCDSSSTDSGSVGVGKGDFTDTGEVAGFANVLANAIKTDHHFGDKLVGTGNCGFIVAIVWKGINDHHYGSTGDAQSIWTEHQSVGHADRNVKKGAILIYSDSKKGHVVIYLGNNKVLNDGQIADANYIEDSWHEHYLGWIDPNDIGYPASKAASEADLASWLTKYEARNPTGV